ncbi:periplasmic heavy metal sensor [Congregibacter variabilis]|uniref:Signaling pathway modulator ZraP n=1 Tax=Congregibacter variabilis TaxID=3081200 RepID=A0ABZ0HXX5_9GAMM|nr:periplasmic heavy metal sensor [Congregibacter sp. IMCC43200]
MNRNSLVLIALLISLALNLLIAGFIVGKHRGSGGERPPMAWAVEQLSPETQRRIRGQMRDQLSEVRPLREDMRKAQAAVRKAVASEDYDPQVLALALEKSREVSERYQALIHKNLVEVSADLPREQRIALARAALQRGQHTKMPPRSPQNER